MKPARSPHAVHEDEERVHEDENENEDEDEDGNRTGHPAADPAHHQPTTAPDRAKPEGYYPCSHPPGPARAPGHGTIEGTPTQEP
ncbi:hypothetical protein ACH4OT_36845 [Streptomyces murinus]|uniref:hypothetical protein n=1 Tax=Streptomyces murinus TaxID=33900 RepID=UPI0037B8D24A